jgi:NAD(P)-dependent dehydrogenase (short-subunit alcohol dehydrogenase family)
MGVALVTGAGSGIGAACARVLGGHGHEVVCADLDLAAAEATVASIAGPGALALRLDVSDPAACEDAVAATVERFGRVDHVVTCAGTNMRAPAHELDLADFRRVMEVNVTGTLAVAQAAARDMIARDEPGSMVFIGSINSVIALPGQTAYGTSKAAVVMLGRILAVDWGAFNIRVNVVGPGLTRTPMAAAMIADEQRLAWAMERIPLQRVGEPEDVAEVVSFLLSDAARNVTGTFLPVDGGWMTGV